MKMKTFLAATTTVLALAAGGASAQSIECGADYTVSPGDTLSNISVAAYGDRSNFQLIYNANSDTIGRNPNIIEVGDRFFIPCVDAPIVASTASAAAITPEETTELLTPAAPAQIRFVTATNWAPFTDEDQAQGGMVPEIVNVAMSKVVEPDGYKIDFVNDWGSHLQPLLSDVAYDFSLAWFRPDCDQIDKLSEDSKFRCNNLDWSEPVYEQVVGYYTTTEFPTPLQHSDLFGSRLCRPAGYATFMLEERDLVEPTITLIRGASPEECFAGLANGEFDVVVLAVDVAEGQIAEQELGEMVVQHEVLGSVSTLHAVTSKNNPNGEAQLAILNEGINQLKDSGEWFTIVRRHLAEHRSK
ncbi:MAG: transporter substrate-binding domain-containing protein [Pseudomonadota bacterium]